MKTKNATLVALGVLAVLATSCKQIDNMENMNNKTNELASTSNQLSETSKSILTTSNQLGSNTEELYHQARTKEAEETRQRARDALRLDSSFEEKVTRAAIYFKSFEFQLWTNGKASTKDNAEFREELMLESVEEFFRTVQSFYAEIGDSNEISPASEDTATRALFALSVTMHELNHAQKERVKEDGVKEICMLSMIEEALKKESALIKGEITLGDLAPHEVAILENAESAKNLLRMRYDILSSMVLAKVSNLGDPTSGTIASTYNQVRYYLASWDSKFAGLNPAQKAQVETFLGEALRMKGILGELEINNQLESKISKIYKNMKIKDNSTCTSGDCMSKADSTSESISNHRAQISELLK